jgi:hypothetical protein
MHCPWMTGRDQVPIEALIDELRATLDEREQVIRALASGVAGSYRFERTTWRVVELFEPGSGA